MSRHWMACFSWSPSSLPGGVIGAREQPQRGPNNEEPTVDPATSGDVRPGGQHVFWPGGRAVECADPVAAGTASDAPTGGDGTHSATACQSPKRRTTAITPQN